MLDPRDAGATPGRAHEATRRPRGHRPAGSRAPSAAERALRRFFFGAPQGAFDAARMHGHAEPSARGRRERDRGEVGIRGALLLQKHDDGGRELVRRAGAALVGQQAAQSRARERGLRLIERLSREAKGTRGARDGSLVDPNPTEHLVLDLKQVATIEERAVGKERVGHFLSAGIEEAARAKRIALGIGREAGRHACRGWHHIADMSI